MFYILIWIGFAVSVFLSFILIPRILVVALRRRLFDLPDERKTHEGAIPRLGGLSFVPTIIFSLSLIISLICRLKLTMPPDVILRLVPEFCLGLCGLTLLYLGGIKDDLVGLRYRTKFLLQVLVASFLPLSGLWIHTLYGLFGIQDLSPWLGIPLTMLVVVCIVNAVNLIDGIDGLASGLSSLALVFLGGSFIYTHAWLYAVLAFSTLGVLLPFFYYNVFGRVERGKKIFMGDTGSQTLGYILSLLSIRYCAGGLEDMPYREETVVLAFSTLIVPVFDVFRVMWVRGRQGRHLFSPDRNHIHHKFLAMGFGPRRAMMLILLLACFFTGLNMVLVSYASPTLILLSDIGLWMGLHRWFDRIRDKRLAHPSGSRRQKSEAWLS